MRTFRFCFFSGFSLVVFLAIDSCVSHDLPEFTCTDAYYFSQDVRPIIESKCAISGCHNGDMGQGLNWLVFENFQQRAQSGLVKSYVSNRIMPPASSPAGPLSPAQINAIVCWTDQGAINN